MVNHILPDTTPVQFHAGFTDSADELKQLSPNQDVGFQE
jgi:hypothetical protein